MSASPSAPLRSLHPELRERLKRLDQLERSARRARRERWHLAEPPADDEGGGWMLSYLDLVTLMLVLLVILVALARAQGGASAGPAVLSAAAAIAQAESTDALAPPPTLQAAAPAQPAAAMPGDTAPIVRAAGDDAGPSAGPDGAEAMPALQATGPGASLPGDAGAAQALPPAPAGSDADGPAPAPAGTMGGVPAPAAVAADGVAPGSLDERAEGSPAADDLPAASPPLPAGTHVVALAGSIAPRAPDAPQRWTLPGFADFAERQAGRLAPSEPVPAGEGMAASVAAVPPPPAPAVEPPPDLAQLGLDGLGDGIDVILNERSVSFRISNELLFPSGQADLAGAGPEVIGRLSQALARHPYPISVEGHTDVIPIQTNRFPSNWELSTARATSVLRQLMHGGVASDRLRAIGYAHTRPIADNGTAEGRATNRRVELIMDIPPGTKPLPLPR